MKKLLISAGLLAMAAAMQPASAADLRPPVLKAPPPVVETWSWTGFYLGGNGGYSWGRSKTTIDYYSTTTGLSIVPPAGSITSDKFNMNGGIAGGQIGYNWQSGNWVWGLEADIQWSGQKGDAAFVCGLPAVGTGPCLPGLTFVPAGVTGTALNLTEKLEWFGTVRGRLGLLWTPSLLAYVTGGLAYGSIKTDAVLGVVNPGGAPVGGIVASAISSSHTNAGWTIGAGLEGRISGNWTAKIEYLYMDLGSVNPVVLSGLVAAPIGARINSDVTDNIVRVGLNYKFGGPVVARY
jgi:outer membrane immunogenic protein